MTTKLEIKFTKLSETFINKIKLAEEEYEKFLTNFIKTEIIGEDYFEESLKDEIQNVRNGFTQWKPYEVIDSYWTSHATVDKLKPQIEARSNASGLTPPRWLWRRVRL